MLKLLLVDDEKVICNGLIALIDWEACGFESPDTTYDGFSALDKMAFNHYDVLLTDIRMPGMSGLDLIHEVYQRYPGCKMIIISGYTDFEYARKAIDCGVLRYILKPIDEYELTACLKETAENILFESEGMSFTSDEKFYGGKRPSSILSEQMVSFNFNKLGEYVLSENLEMAYRHIQDFIHLLVDCCPPATTRFCLCSALVLQLLQIVTDTGKSLNTVLGMEFNMMLYINTSTIDELQQNLLLLCNKVLSFIADKNTKKIDENMENLIQYIREHCTENLTLIELSKIFFMNPVYLGRKFRDYSGVGMRYFLHSCRLDYAKKILLESKQSIQGIAASSGFNDINVFYLLFKKETGMTPTQYRALFSK